MKKVLKFSVVLFSTLLYFVSLSTVSFASPWVYHSPEVPEELLKKKN